MVETARGTGYLPGRKTVGREKGEVACCEPRHGQVRVVDWIMECGMAWMHDSSLDFVPRRTDKPQAGNQRDCTDATRAQMVGCKKSDWVVEDGDWDRLGLGVGQFGIWYKLTDGRNVGQCSIRDQVSCALHGCANKHNTRSTCVTTVREAVGAWPGPSPRVRSL